MFSINNFILTKNLNKSTIFDNLKMAQHIHLYEQKQLENVIINDSHEHIVIKVWWLEETSVWPKMFLKIIFIS